MKEYKLKCIVAGGRDYNSRDELFAKLDYLFKCQRPHETLIISGGAKGADALGEQYAKEKGFDLAKE